MDRATLSQRIESILNEITRLSNTLYAMDNTNIQRHSDNYEMLSTEAALRGEVIACRLRHLIYETTTIRKAEYLTSAGVMQGISVIEKDGILEITLPCLLPKKSKKHSCEYLTDPIYYTLSKYAQTHTLPKFRHCVVCFSHIYSRELSPNRVRDYDNLEIKQLLDVIATFVMEDDIPITTRQRSCGTARPPPISRNGVKALCFRPRRNKQSSQLSQRRCRTGAVSL